MKELNLDKNKKYLLACSFGPDSMALFYMLKKEGYNFDAAIVNYHIRIESTSEVEGLVKYAKENNVKVYVKKCDKNPAGKTEAKCREIRYSFFAKLFKQNHYDALLVAHHQDDHLETYIIQKQRQNCPIYFGIQEKTQIKGMTVIRPLLSYSKKELEDICVKNNVPFAIDKTNFDKTILRNKIRHEKIARMSKEDRANLLKEIEEENRELQRVLSSIDKGKIHSCEYLLSLDELTLKYSLNFLVKDIRENLYLSKENVGEISKALNSKKPNIFFKIKGNLFFIKEYDFIDIVNAGIPLIEYSYILDKPGILDTPYFYLDFSKDSSNRNVRSNDYPIQIRNAKLDDYIFINGYKVFVRRLFIDWKMPLRLRARWPIIISDNGDPLYIPRYQKNFVPTDGINFYVK